MLINISQTSKDDLSGLLIQLLKKPTSKIVFAQPADGGYKISDSNNDPSSIKIEKIYVSHGESPSLVSVENPVGADVVIYVVRKDTAVPDDVLTNAARERNCP
jgi:hypothetical protein